MFVACVLKGWKGGWAILNFPNSNKKEMQRDFFAMMRLDQKIPEEHPRLALVHFY